MTRSIQKLFGAAAIGALLVAVGGAESEAATANDSFNVSAQVFGACTFTANNFNFPGYNTGQVSNEPGQTAWTVNCPAVNAANPLPVTFTMDPVGGVFEMRRFVFLDILNYRLCNDANCTQIYAAGVAGPPVTVDSAAFTYDLHGQILGNQTVPTGPYFQFVNATLTY